MEFQSGSVVEDACERDLRGRETRWILRFWGEVSGNRRTAGRVRAVTRGCRGSARRKMPGRAEARRLVELWSVFPSRTGDRNGWRTESDLGRCDPLDEHHGAAASGAGPDGGCGIGGGGLFGPRCRCRSEQLKAKRQESGTPPVGEKAEVPDANEALR